MPCSRCHKKFREVIQKEGDSVWSWYIQNITAPHRLAQNKVDRIVANPPWVKMAEIQAQKRKRDLEAMAQRPDMDVWTGGKQAPHFDIAQLFIKRARQLYLADSDRQSSRMASQEISHWGRELAQVSRLAR